MSRGACQKRVNAFRRMSIAERCVYGRCMPRLPRRQIPDGLYHVTTRGNRRQPIVLEDRDCEVFLVLLGKVVKRLGWKVHAYCLMTNHYHLLLRAGETGFAAGMQLLNCGHAHRMNRKRGRTGHLFRNHYSWRPVESDEHLLEAIRYILLNPVRAGICAAPEDWRWSSYRATADLELPPDFLALSDLLAIFGTTPSTARDAFRNMFE
jgi:putative transposase